MISTLADEALEIADVVRGRIRDAGGVNVLRSAAADPSTRESLSASLLDPTGIWDLSPLDDGVELEAAAAVSRATGEFGFPFPVAERLAHQEGFEATAFVSRTEQRRAAQHVDLPLSWSILDLDGAGYDIVSVADAPIGTLLAPFVSELTVRANGTKQLRSSALLLTLQSWSLLGSLDTALADTVRYTEEREQFGRPIQKFQSIGFQLADMSVATHGLEELAKYTLWSLRQDETGEAAIVDALSLRAASIEAAGIVFRGAHQLHGAMGFTSEVDISWLSRASQAVRRLPESESQTRGMLARLIAQNGYAGVVGAVAH